MKLRLLILAVVVLAFATVGYLYLNNQLGVVNPERTTVEAPIDEDTFVRAYIELATLAETTPIGTPAYESAKARVLERMGLTPEKVEKQLASYNTRPEQWRPIWEKIQAELQRRAQQAAPPTSPPAGGTR